MTRRSGRSPGRSNRAIRCFHPEAMLLIDDDQAERVEYDALLNERMGTHVQPRSTRLDALERRAPLGRRQSTGQKRDLDAQRLHERPQRRGVLLCQNLRRGHQRRLVPALGGEQHSEQRNSGLTPSPRHPAGDGSCAVWTSCRRRFPGADRAWASVRAKGSASCIGRTSSFVRPCSMPGSISVALRRAWA